MVILVRCAIELQGALGLSYLGFKWYAVLRLELCNMHYAWSNALLWREIARPATSLVQLVLFACFLLRHIKLIQKMRLLGLLLWVASKLSQSSGADKLRPTTGLFVDSTLKCHRVLHSCHCSTWINSILYLLMRAFKSTSNCCIIPSLLWHKYQIFHWH